MVVPPKVEPFPVELMDLTQEPVQSTGRQEWYEKELDTCRQILGVVVKVNEYIGKGTGFLITIFPLLISHLFTWKWGSFVGNVKSCLNVSGVVGKMFGYIVAAPVVPSCMLVKWTVIGAIHLGALVFGTAKDSISYDGKF